MDLIYRRGTMNDLDAIQLLVKAAVAQMNDQGIDQWDGLYPVREDFEQDIREKQLFVGVSDNQIAAIFTLNNECDEEYKNGEWKEPDKPFLVVHRLCVSPQFQNRGIAKQMMKQAEKAALSCGIKAVRLDVYSKNPFALKVYESCGYSKVGMVEWRKGLFYLMEKYL